MDHIFPLLADHPQLVELCRLLGNNIIGGLDNALSQTPTDSNVFLRIEGSLCTSPEATITIPSNHDSTGSAGGTKLLLGYIDLRSRVATDSQRQSQIIDDTIQRASSISSPESFPNHPLTPESSSHLESDEDGVRKRRKVVGGLRLRNGNKIGSIRPATCVNACHTVGDCPHNNENRSNILPRQVHGDTRFPQRKPPQEPIIPALESTSGEKLIRGIWRQIFSGVRLSLSEPAYSTINVHGVVDQEVFRAINTVCLKYSSLSQSARTVEMIVQAYWVECYEARIAALKLERPSKSSTEVRMDAIKEACSILQWKEKELRNKLAIWRGYRAIKEAGGWASLAFASSGVYRFCKYRTGFDDTFISRLQQLRHSFEITADTLHPEWRQLLSVIGQQTPPRYTGHPHEWVVTEIGTGALPLSATYAHISGDFIYEFIEESLWDRDIFGAEDPRRVVNTDPHTCQECHQYQSDNVKINRCMCFPFLYGNPRSPPPLQIFQTTNGRNNGVVTRCDLERGTAIGEFVGYITTGIEGMDVMIAGSQERQYQIYQGQMGNFTRFVNHSCRPNCQFQKFYWLGTERIIIVSRGVPADAELTVDYSNHYWEQLDKRCLCGEACCRYSRSDWGPM
ncbi:hypothetical protein ACJ72_04700 [Emergomyces africanus]|uniref:SET domain-containing protein n=1 Tax=Emergomyces africanus TaxID=1955775 RepID=A0A1B7NW10_9EURO|nr:hypothetical protein ACJ72_04700 [Emergomyces africanus]